MRILSVLLVLAALGASGEIAFRCWPRKLYLATPKPVETVQVREGRPAVTVPGRILLGELAKFDDGLFAYLMFDYYRSRDALENAQVTLTSEEEGDKPVYHVRVRLVDDVINGVTRLAELKASGLTASVQFQWVGQDRFARDLQQTSVFIKAYENPSTRRLEDLHARELHAYLLRFIRFKSLTDPRMQTATEMVPSPLSPKEASRLAADIIAVSSFYGIPLDMFIGIAAMENNYMSIPGDLTNTAWKRRPEPGDVVLERRRHRVLVWNHSIGVWQITRQSLRYAHRLYLSDKRDYAELPERLRPPKVLDVDNVDPAVLTTYAGLLLRDLLDRFHGDVTKAVGAYNGGYRTPNLQYAAGVQMVADYARRVIGHAAELKDAKISNTAVDHRVVKPEKSVKEKRNSS